MGSDGVSSSSSATNAVGLSAPPAPLKNNRPRFIRRHDAFESSLDVFLDRLLRRKWDGPHFHHEAFDRWVVDWSRGAGPAS